MAKGLGNLFGSAGKGMMELMSRWWSHGAPDVAKILELKPLKEIPNAIYEARLLDNKLSKEIINGMDEARKGILDNIKSVGSELRSVSTKVDMSRRQLNLLTDKLRDPSRSYPGLETTIKKQNEYLESLVKKEDALSQRLKILQNYDTNIKTNPQSVVTQLEMTPEITSEFPSLSRWKDLAEQHIVRKNQIVSATSKNLNSDRQFLKEYLEKIAPLENENELKIRWLANPQNQIKLTELKMKPKYMRKIMGVAEEEKPKEINSNSISNIAKKLGIGIGATAGVTAAVAAIYSWASKNSTEVDRNSENMLSMLMSVNSRGLGGIILDDVKNSVSKIHSATDNLKVKMGVNPQEAMSGYFNVLSTEKAEIDKNIKQWNAVVVGAENQDAAKKLGVSLKAFSDNLEKQMNDATGILEGAGTISKAPSLEAGQNNISELQNYLKKFNSSVGVTGVLDQPTIDTLKRLEDRYNRTASTNRFTGLFYNPTTKRVIDTEDLINLEKI